MKICELPSRCEQHVSTQSWFRSFTYEMVFDDVRIPKFFLRYDYNRYTQWLFRRVIKHPIVSQLISIKWLLWIAYNSCTKLFSYSFMTNLVLKSMLSRNGSLWTKRSIAQSSNYDHSFSILSLINSFIDSVSSQINREDERYSCHASSFTISSLFL
jgi:hypothetical protein